MTLKARGGSLKPGDPRAKVRGWRGGIVSGVARKLSGLERWQKLYPHIPPADAAEIYALGYRAGLQAKYQEAKRHARKSQESSNG